MTSPVFVVLLGYDYEGSEVCGVFSTKDKALEWLSTRSRPGPSEEYFIEQWNIDNPTVIGPEPIGSWRQKDKWPPKKKRRA